MVIIKIGFIGAGKVGFSIGRLLKENGCPVSGYYSQTEQSSYEASVFTGTKHFKAMNNIILESDIIFITVPDDEILNVYSEIKNFSLKDKIICHTSGCLSSQIFSDIDDLDAYSYSIHPMFPISSKTESYKELKKAVFTIEGHEKHLSFFMNLFSSMGINIIPIDSKDKILYHLASVTVSNLFLSLMKRSCSYLNEYGFNEKDALKALFPLIQNNIDNALRSGITAALTGPVERNDIHTVSKHIESMPEEHRSVYIQLSTELLSIAKTKNRNRDYSNLEKYLEDKNEKHRSNL